MVDGAGGYVPMAPRDLRHQGNAKAIPVMIGTNKDESNIMIIGGV